MSSYPTPKRSIVLEITTVPVEGWAVNIHPELFPPSVATLLAYQVELGVAVERETAAKATLITPPPALVSVCPEAV